MLLSQVPPEVGVEVGPNRTLLSKTLNASDETKRSSTRKVAAPVKVHGLAIVWFDVGLTVGVQPLQEVANVPTPPNPNSTQEPSTAIGPAIEDPADNARTANAVSIGFIFPPNRLPPG